ncbi:MAG TPA: ferritin [Candidatus Cloacimonadota bacterium]|nr:ferritin [Candidatus Cloacimonadota bacterium]
MISKKIQNALNEQINRETYSEYLYLSMEAWFTSQNLDGFAHWMNIQQMEEKFHSMKFFHYILSRGGTVELKALAAPQVKFDSPLQIFTLAYEHEQYITKSINDLMALAIKENDQATQSMLQWYVDEQVEEEQNTDKMRVTLKSLGKEYSGLMMLDREAMTRVFTPPTTTP